MKPWSPLSKYLSTMCIHKCTYVLHIYMYVFVHIYGAFHVSSDDPYLFIIPINFSPDFVFERYPTSKSLLIFFGFFHPITTLKKNKKHLKIKNTKTDPTWFQIVIFFSAAQKVTWVNVSEWNDLDWNNVCFLKFVKIWAKCRVVSRRDATKNKIKSEIIGYQDCDNPNRRGMPHTYYICLCDN